MPLTDIDRQIIAAILAAAEEHPDYVYAGDDDVSCAYAPDERNPLGCIIGHACRQVFGEDAPLKEGVGAARVLAWLGASRPVADWGGAVQSGQDVGHPWAVAVRRAGPPPEGN